KAHSSSSPPSPTIIFFASLISVFLFVGIYSRCFSFFPLLLLCLLLRSILTNLPSQQATFSALLLVSSHYIDHSIMNNNAFNMASHESHPLQPAPPGFGTSATMQMVPSSAVPCNYILIAKN